MQTILETKGQRRRRRQENRLGLVLRSREYLPYLMSELFQPSRPTGLDIMVSNSKQKWLDCLHQATVKVKSSICTSTSQLDEMIMTN